MKNWRKIFESPSQHRAQIVQSVLQTYSLPAVIVNKKDTTYHFGPFWHTLALIIYCVP